MYSEKEGEKERAERHFIITDNCVDEQLKAKTNNDSIAKTFTRSDQSKILLSWGAQENRRVTFMLSFFSRRVLMVLLFSTMLSSC